MLFADTSAELDGYRMTAAGYLVADVRFARTGIQEYAGREIERADLTVAKVYRPVESVFDARAMRSFGAVPLTLGHPIEAVGAASWRQHSVGVVGDDVRRDGDYVRTTIIVQDGDAIEMIKNGTRELSAGYACSLHMEDGTAAAGAYHAVQRTIRGNHVAIVDRARAGSACRIG